MSVKAKYQAVLDLGELLAINDGNVTEENGVLKIKGQANTQYEKNVLWDKIKEIGGEQPYDLKANISVADESVFHRHTVKSGESLSKIFEEIDDLEKTDFEQKHYKQYNELAYNVMKVAFVILLTGVFFDRYYFLQIP